MRTLADGATAAARPARPTRHVPERLPQSLACPVLSAGQGLRRIDELCRRVARPGCPPARHRAPLLGFVYAGTTTNWPEMFEHTPCIIGLVTHIDYGSDEADGKQPLPRAALAPRAIPDEIWTALAEHGIELEAETGTYLAVAGRAWTQINGADGQTIVGVSAEDDGYLRIDDEERVMRGDEPLTMRTSYC